MRGIVAYSGELERVYNPGMGRRSLLLCVMAAVLFLEATGGTRAESQASITYFEGPRLIAGDGSPPIERAAFVVQDGKIVAAGAQGEVTAPAGSTRVSLAGKTVIPALVNLHGHVGYQRGWSYVASNYTRDNIVDHLNRYAYYGIGTVASLGTDAGEIPRAIQRDQRAGSIGGAWLRHAGRGFALPNAGPGFAAMRAAPYGVTTADEARAGVRELAAAGVDVVKIWVDDRGGTVPKLPIEISRAIIDEAHAHKLRVVAHVYYLDDAKALARAGIDGFAHPVRDAEADDELIELLRAGDVFVMANLGLTERGIRAERPSWLDDPFLRESIDQAAATRVTDALAKRQRTQIEQAAATYQRMTRSIAKLDGAGIRVLLGSDSGVQDHFMGYAEHRELALMVDAGMEPDEVIAAATGRAAAAFGLADVGTLVPGKSADFVVLNANPLDRIANTQQIAQVYLRGSAVDRTALRTAWRAAK
jgi:imidazolonepropionase-like amidohydrolase